MLLRFSAAVGALLAGTAMWAATSVGGAPTAHADGPGLLGGGDSPGLPGGVTEVLEETLSPPAEGADSPPATVPAVLESVAGIVAPSETSPNTGSAPLPVVAPVLEMVAPVTGPALDTLAPVTTPVLDMLAPVTAPVLDTLAPVTAPVLDTLAPVTAPVLDTLGPVTALVLDNVSPVTPAAPDASAPAAGPLAVTPGASQPMSPAVPPNDSSPMMSAAETGSPGITTVRTAAPTNSATPAESALPGAPAVLFAENPRPALVTAGPAARAASPAVLATTSQPMSAFASSMSAPTAIESTFVGLHGPSLASPPAGMSNGAAAPFSSSASIAVALAAVLAAGALMWASHRVNFEWLVPHSKAWAPEVPPAR